MFAAVAGFGLATAVFALSTSIVLSCLALAILGWADMISVVIRASLVQLETPDEMRGESAPLMPYLSAPPTNLESLNPG